MYEAILRLANNLHKYGTYLEKQNEKMQEHHEKLSCINQVDEWHFLQGKSDIAPGTSARYRTLHLELEMTEPYCPIFLSDHIPSDSRRMHEYLKNIVVPYSVAMYSYTGTRIYLHFVWKVSSEPEDVRMT